MRILIVSHTYIVDLNREKWRQLARLYPDCEVAIAIPRRWRPGGVQNQTIVSESQREGNFQIRAIANFSENNQGLLTFGVEIIPFLRSFKPDIIQVEQGVKSFAYAQLIILNRLLGLGAKNLFFTWWNLPYRSKFPISLLENYNLRHTDGLVAGNQDAADILRDHGYRGAGTVMPQLGVDETLFKPQKQPELKEKLDIKPSDLVIGFVGRFVPEKGILTLLNAVARLHHPHSKLLLLGRGELKDRVLIEAKERGIGDRLLIVESVPHNEVARYINLMDVLVLPSETTEAFTTLTARGWKEQFGHVLIEAMACKVPVIGSDSGEIPHVIGDAGLIFPEGDANALGRSLLEILDNPERRQQLATAGYQRTLEKYTNRALAEEIVKFYRDLLA
jgi:glycosyltransferase involved in cell wall biosynthesis